MKLLLDEMLSPDLATTLQHSGYDVVSVRECGTTGWDDPAQLRHAIPLGRAIATYNINHFAALVQRLAARSEDHFGVVLISRETIRQQDFGGLVRVLAALCRANPAEDALANQCLFLRPASDEP